MPLAPHPAGARWRDLLGRLEARLSHLSTLAPLDGASARALRAELEASGEWASLAGARSFSARWDEPLTPLRATLFRGTQTAWLRLVEALDLHWAWLARPSTQRVAAQGDLSALTSLTLSVGQEQEPDDPTDAIAGLARACPHLTSLAAVTLSQLGWVGERAAAVGAALACAPAGARSLAVEEGVHTAPQLGALLGADRSLRWEALSLSRARVEGDLLGPQALGGAFLARLRSLRLHDVRVEVSAQGVRFALASLAVSRAQAQPLLEALAAGGALRPLEVLSLGALDDDGEALLAALGGWLADAPLRRLSLRGLSLYDADSLGALLSGLPSLASLSLRDQLYGAEVVEALTRAQGALRTLDLRGCALGEEGAQALLSAGGSRALGSLARLRLYTEDVGPDGAQALLDSPLGRAGGVRLEASP